MLRNKVNSFTSVTEQYQFVQLLFMAMAGLRRRRASNNLINEFMFSK